MAKKVALAAQKEKNELLLLLLPLTSSTASMLSCAVYFRTAPVILFAELTKIAETQCR